MFSNLIPMTKIAHLGPKKWPYWAIKAQNDPKIRAELNSLNAGNDIKRKLFVYISKL